MSNNNNTKQKKELIDTKFPVAQLMFTIASFVLAFLDMILLYGSINSVMKVGNGQAMVIAFALATVANFTALMWGYENGRNMSKGVFNKHARGSFVGWAAIGVFYIAIKIMEVIKGDGGNIQKIIIELLILAVSYIGTGVVISSSVAKIANRDAQDARKYEKRFSIAHEDLMLEVSEVQSLVKTLKDYNQTYESLEKQRNIIEKSIIHAENASMSSVEGRIIADNPQISPELVHEIVNGFMEKRRNELESNLQN